MAAEVIEQQSGRVHVIVRELAEQFASDLFDLSGQGRVGQLLEIPVGGITRGQLLTSATVVDDPASGPPHQYLYLDVLIVGHIAGAPVLMARYALDRWIGQARFEFGESTTFNSISIWGRQVVDGAGNSSVRPKQAQLQVTGTFWR